MRASWLRLVPLIALVACKIDSTVYQPPADDDDGDASTQDAGTDAPDGIYVVVNPGNTTVSEGGQVTVRIKLSEAPPADRPIAITGSSLLTPTPSTVTFTATNWNVERTIIFAAGQDDDADDSPVTVLFDGMGDVADGVCMVMITDDDQQVLLVSPPNNIGVTEGSTGQVQVQLAARPSASVVVSVTSMDTAVASVSPATLTFTTTNWNMAQPVTVTGAQDANTADNTTLLILDPALDGVPTHTVAINITDDDILAIDASPANLGTIVEGGSGVTLGVRLTQMPPGNVDVSLSSSSSSVNVSSATLSFTPGNYNTVQNVTVSAPQDVNVIDENVTIQLSATGLADRFVQVAVDDNDTQVVQVTPNPSLGITEGNTGNFSVTLAFQPAGAVIVDVTSGDSSIASVGTSQLTFGPADYNLAQTVVVTGVQDVDLANEVTSVSFNAASEGLTTNRTVNVTDDDTQVLDVSPLSIAVAEGGTNTYGVALTYQPSGNVTVMNTVAAGNSGDISAAPGSMTFTPMNYDTAQTVTVTGLQDSDVTNETAMITVSSSGVPSRQVTVNVSDDDSLGIVVTPATITVNEGGPSMNIMVSLAAMPAGNMTVNLATMPTGVASLGAASLTFTPGNYNMPQPVSVTGTQDADGLDGATTIHLTATGLDEKTVPVTVVDDDTVVPVLTPNPYTLEEGKEDSSVLLTLSRDPGRAVLVDVPAFGFTDFSVQPTSYAFDSTDWDSPQRVTLLAFEDDTDDDETEDVLFTIPNEGTQTTLRVNITDPTILLGFPPPHGSNTAGLTGLEAWRDGQMPQCFLVEKIIADVATAPTQLSAISVGLYTTGFNDGAPDRRLYASGSYSLGPGAGLRVIDVPDTTIYSAAGAVTTWLAVEVTTGVTLKTKTAANPHCARMHTFGDFMPDPFNSAGSGGGSMQVFDAGTTDAGTVTVTCNQSPPVAVWIVGRDATCINPI